VAHDVLLSAALLEPGIVGGCAVLGLAIDGEPWALAEIMARWIGDRSVAVVRRWPGDGGGEY
jgi:hypothetical protein